MKARHTPGPWTYALKTPTVDTIRVSSPDLLEICLIAYSNDREADLADARLIAAAPEMLEALKRALQPVPLDSSCPAELQKRTELMLAAIAKAEGSTLAEPAAQASRGAANGEEDEG